jgi:hypothetical protein
MSDDFHRPTLTFPNKAYNATQVRLYGIKPPETASKLIIPGQNITIENALGEIDITFSIKPDETKEGKEALARLLKNVSRDGRDADAFAEMVMNFPRDAELAKIAYLTQLTITTRQMGNIAITTTISARHAVSSGRTITCGIIVGYAFEGHTYDLPKPKIMVIPTAPELNIPADDSGYDKKEDHDYAVWLVDKLDECLEFEMNQGFVEQLILEANTPGRRAPNIYSMKMMTGHRGGKLME